MDGTHAGQRPGVRRHGAGRLRRHPHRPRRQPLGGGRRTAAPASTACTATRPTARCSARSTCPRPCANLCFGGRQEEPAVHDRQPVALQRLRRGARRPAALTSGRGAARLSSIGDVYRIETTQGSLARRGFVDVAAAERAVQGWPAPADPLLDLLAAVGRSRPGPRRSRPAARRRPRPDRPAGRRAAAGPAAGHGPRSQQHADPPSHRPSRAAGSAGSRAGQDPGRRAARASCCHAVGADPDATPPVARDLTGNALRIAYRGALLRIASRDLCSPEPIEAVAEVADELSDLADATLEAALSIARAKLGEDAICDPAGGDRARQVRSPGAELRQRCRRALRG